MNQAHPPEPGTWNGLRRSGFKRKPRYPRVRREKSIVTGGDTSWPRRPSVKKVPTSTPGVFRIAGVLWPVDYMPEITPEYAGGPTFHKKVGDLLFACGWKFWHCTDPFLSDEGFPDYVAFREREVWLELKVRDRDGKANTMSAGQRAFANTIIRAGGEFHDVLWPDDWDALVEVLKK